MLDETRIRLEAIQHVRTLRERWPAVPASELRGFTFDGRRVLLRGQQGIFKPAALSEPLSLTTTISSDYTHDTIEGSCVMYDFVPPTREHENEAHFRNAVLDAYRDHCAVCELHVRALLDAAHVKPGYDVADGVALCATHHRAFDTGVLTFDGDYNVHVHTDEPTL